MIKLSLSILFFLASTLVVFKAPTNFLWRFTVALTEFPHLFILASLALLIFCFWPSPYRFYNIVLSGTAFIIFSSTIVRTYSRASKIDSELTSIFSNKNYSLLKNPIASPFSFFTLFLLLQMSPRYSRGLMCWPFRPCGKHVHCYQWRQWLQVFQL